MNAKEIWGEFRLGFGGDDSWHHVMHWWFTVADELYFRGVALPAAWRFRPSPLGPSNDPDDYVTGAVTACSDSLLLMFGRALNRYAKTLRAAGLSY